jgi:hypothetical protein
VSLVPPVSPSLVTGLLELGALEEDLLLEPAEGRSGLQAEFLTKDSPDLLVGA